MDSPSAKVKLVQLKGVTVKVAPQVQIETHTSI